MFSSAPKYLIQVTESHGLISLKIWRSSDFVRSYESINVFVFSSFYCLFYTVQAVSNSNWTEWSTIQGVIAQVISKSDEREA